MGRATNLVIAAVVAFAAASFVVWHATRDRLPSAAGIVLADCTRANDPPVCLIEKSLGYGEAQDDLRAVVRSGATSLIKSNQARLVSAVQHYSTIIPLPTGNAGRQQFRAASPAVIVAAIALASAAQHDDEPFSNATVQTLFAAAGNAPESAQIAATLWDEGYLADWNADLVKPRGLKSIWHAVAASPPTEPALLNEIALRARSWAAAEDIEALSRATLDRVGAEPTEPTFGAYGLAPELVEAWKKNKSEAALQQILYACVNAIDSMSYLGGRCDQHIDVLREAGRRDALNTIADKLLEQARRAPDPTAAYQPQMFRGASEVYLLAGNKPAALAAAREGLAFVGPAVLMHWYDRTPPPLRTALDKQRAAARTGDYGLSPAFDPVVALYRMGAREEALRNGFLSGFQRYTNASEAGEAADPTWIVDDHAPESVAQMIEHLIKAPNPDAARKVYDSLLCEGPSFYERPFAYQPLDHHLGLLAALLGRRGSMNAHFAAAARDIETLSNDETLVQERARKLAAMPTIGGPTQTANGIVGQRTQVLAETWRRATTIAERVGASDDVLAPAECTGRAAKSSTP